MSTPEQTPRVGYRVERLRRRRRSFVERCQLVVLVLFAVVVAFAAVFGAWYLAPRLFGGEEQKKEQPGCSLLLLFRSSDGVSTVASVLAVQDATSGRCSAYTIPDELLLVGQDGEYVFAGDDLARGGLRRELQRAIKVPIDGEHVLPASALIDLAGGGRFSLALREPVSLSTDAGRRFLKPGQDLDAHSLERLLGLARGREAPGGALQAALVRSAFRAAASRSSDALDRDLKRIVPGESDEANRLRSVLRGLCVEGVVVAKFPSTPRVAEGQFAFVPNVAKVMTMITRRSAAYRARYTVIVRNGSGRVGAGQEVVSRLSGLDVNIEPVGNADSFGYQRTQILAGKRALTVAEDIRAILKTGVVLDGSGLSPTTVLVVVGADFKTANSTAKGKP